MRYSRAVRAVWRFLKSTRVAVVLILVIVALSLASTFVPQGRPAAWYEAHLPRAFAAFIRAVGLDAFFRSAIFLVPVALFTVNLGACTVDRIVSRARRSAAHRYGPDLVHLGLLVLVAAGLVTGLTRQETALELAQGEEASLGGRAVLRVDSLRYIAYDDGRPRDWITTVDVTGSRADPVSSFPISVNHPLRLPGLTVYQSSWDTRGLLDVIGPDGAAGSATTGEGFTEGDSFWYFAEVRQDAGQWHAVFEQLRGKTIVATKVVSAGEMIGPFRVRRVAATDVTGLKAVRDPGLAPFLVAALVILAGLGLTLVQKKGDGTA